MNKITANNVFLPCQKLTNSNPGGGGAQSLIIQGQNPFFITFLAETRSVFCALI